MLFLAMVLSTIIIVHMWYLLSASLPILFLALGIYAVIISVIIYLGAKRY
jgi:hypothetical protein